MFDFVASHAGPWCASNISYKPPTGTVGLPSKIQSCHGCHGPREATDLAVECIEWSCKAVLETPSRLGQGNDKQTRSGCFWTWRIHDTWYMYAFQNGRNKIYLYHINTHINIPADRDVRRHWNTPLARFRSSLPLPRFGVWALFWTKCYGMDCFGAYFTHVQTCDVTRVQSATEWTASVHSWHMSKPVM